jgi:hypothetical protein
VPRDRGEKPKPKAINSRRRNGLAIVEGHWRILKAYGSGSASAGLRRLIETYRERIQAEIDGRAPEIEKQSENDLIAALDA